MATTAAAKKPSTASAKRQKNACDLLDADHKAVKALFKEERTEMFTKARASKLDLAGMAEQLKQRKDELMAEKAGKAVTPVAELSVAL
jgi:predicted lipoprotein